MKNNFQRFLKQEKKEINDLETGQESFKKYYKHTVNLIKNYFIPCEGNNHQPKILRTHSLIVIVILLLLVKFGVTGYLFLIYPNEAKMGSEMTAEILSLINTERLKNKLSLLKLDNTLSASALGKADNMVIMNYFSHYGPDNKKPWDWINRETYPYLFVGENLAMNFYTAKAAHEALMASPLHKQNILNNRYQDIGLAVVTGEINGEKTNILVELFASRKQPSLVLKTVTERIAGTTNDNTKNATNETKVLSATKQMETNATRENQSASSSLVSSDLGSKTASTDISTNTVADLEAKITKTVSDQTRQSLFAGLVAADDNFLSPNADLSAGTANEIKYYEAQSNRSVLAEVLKWSKTVYFICLAFLIAVLLVNIFIRITIQHKSVIIETLIVIIFISSLITIKMHFLEYIVDKIAII